MALEPGIFDLKSDHDLLRKLEHDFQRVVAEPTDSFACFDFFVTAEQMADWHVGPDDASKFRKQHAILRACSHMANHGKHHTPDRHNAVAATNTTITVTIGGETYPESHAPRGGETNAQSKRSEFWVTFELAEATELGAQYLCVTDLAERLLNFWRERLTATASGSRCKA